MGRIRVAVAVLAGLVGVSAIFFGVRLSTHGSKASLSTESSVIPEADAPRDDNRRDRSTDTTVDLNLFAAPSTSPRPTTTSTSAPPASPTTVPRGFALVHVTNSTGSPVNVWLGDADEHNTVLPAGHKVDWVVKTSSTTGDRGGARVDGTNCGGTWSGVDNVVDRHEYHLEIKPSLGFCALGQAMPMIVLTDYTIGASKTIAGLLPDLGHALVYVHNLYDAATKLTIVDVDTIEWTMDPSVWGAPQLLTTSNDHSDSATVTRVDNDACGYGDSADYFTAGHTYRVDVVKGSSFCSGGRGPALSINDLTTGATAIVG